ncbi:MULTISPECIES: error-prone DNA polymerase [Ramlibacter]|uniref:Error-prone DNA polymerase n=1 Tax=Ramlibacter aquaticus TaxID=2780094 RepID=A0ABR9SDF2_9BURK|nr:MULTISPECIES: error-prone DNA polymerase [Ramlibacter]MBE7940325.1 error-prone DNA polymerase [Ramlibacter aquaticus]
MPEIQAKPPSAVLDEARELPPVLTPGGERLPDYAELHCISNFSFQRGASHPQELVRRAFNLGYSGLALTDECSVAGVVRAWSGWNEYRAYIERLDAQDPGNPRLRPFQLMFGAEFDMGDGRLVAIARDLAGWGGLCQFITHARRAAPKGAYKVGWSESDFSLLSGCEVLFAPRREAGPAFDGQALARRLLQLRHWWGEHAWLAVELPHAVDDDLWLSQMRAAGRASGLALVASGDVHMHLRSRKPLQDVLTAVRLGKPVAECGTALQGNAERHLRQRSRIAESFPADLLRATQEVQRRCRFDIREVRYNYPLETVPPGLTPAQGLRQLSYEGAKRRYPQGIPQRVRQLLEKELALIAECQYEMFFLTVHDIVRFAESEGILCQGRGSAANSVVCFCLGITAMDPMHSEPLLERFISTDRRNEPPDIDVDFEHERREQVIQYIYRKYGRDRAAIAAVVICYRTRSAIRDVGLAMGIPLALVDAFAKDHHWFEDRLAVQRLADLAASLGIALPQHQVAHWLSLTWELLGFPRHLSQHVGGFVLTQTLLTRLVPVENAAMPDRSVIQWDKDDLEDMGLMKVDVLALGMLTALQRCMAMVSQARGRPFGRYDIPPEDAATFEMICRADTVGVFQIESRAQMSMLPRLKPRRFYDLVVEVAIVRPGPIVGGMVHPYLQARERVARGEPIVYERSTSDSEVPALQAPLARTLGIPIFQEQVMQIAMVAAGFSATEADALRRAMAAWKRKGGVDRFEQRLLQGMRQKGYSEDFAQRIFRQIEGFGEYGFPESHAYSFALLAYMSSWLKCHEPACFLAALLNSQPMGFYSPSQLVQDGRRHGIVVLPPDVSFSGWDCSVSPSDAEPRSRVPGSADTVRLGLRMVAHLPQTSAERIVVARQQGGFSSTEDLALRAGLDVRDLNALAAADALKSLSGHRRQQVWDASALRRAPAMLREASVNEPSLELPQAGEGEEIVFDYASLGLTLRRHPLALLRERLRRMKLMSAAELQDLPSGRAVRTCGIVTVRQQPQTANGTIFVTLEDETGPINVIVWKSVREKQRDALLRSRLLAVSGRWQRDEATGNVRNLIAEHLQDLTPLLGRLARQPRTSRDFH